MTDWNRPRLLKPDDELDAFSCGTDALDEWLARRAWRNQQNGASRTYVLTETRTVKGYYALAVGEIAHGNAPGRLRRNMPDPIPVMILGRLAIDRSVQGQGVGRALLKDAMLRTAQAADIAGIAALLVHAIDEDALGFYLRHRFDPLPGQNLTVYLRLSEIRSAIRNA